MGNNICSTVDKWYESLAWKHDIPLLMLDVPHGTKADFEPDKLDYVQEQLQGIMFETRLQGLQEVMEARAQG